MPTIEWNKTVWDTAYTWPKDGDEWDDSARFCGVPYEKWKDELVRAFIVPHIKPDSQVLEIGPGHGRWSALIPHRITKGTLHLIDLSQSCIEFCKKRLAEHQNVKYLVNDGRRLDGIADKSIDFVWSFDTFVHIEEPEVRSYAREFARAMKPQSMGVIHHSGSPTFEQKQSGMRSEVGGRKFGAIFAEAGLHVIRQVAEWGQGCNMKLTGDTMTVFARP